MDRGRLQGSITIFLSLMLIVLISLFTVSLESAHLMAVRGQIGMGSEAAMYTLLSKFEKSLYENYKLLFLNDRQDFKSTLKQEMAYYEQPADSLKKSGNHLLFTAETIEISKMVYLLDANADAFQKEVLEILPADMIAFLKNQLGNSIKQLSQSITLTGYLNQMMEKQPVLQEMTEQVSQLADQTGTIERRWESYLDQKKTCEELIAACKKKESPKTDETGGEHPDSSIGGSDPELEKQVRDLVKEMGTERENLIKEYRRTLKTLESYEEGAGKVQESVQNIKEGLKDEELKEEYREILHEELKGLSDMTSDTGSYGQQLKGLKKNLQQNLSVLESVKLPGPEEITMDTIRDGSVEKALQDSVNKMQKIDRLEVLKKEGEVDKKYGFSAKQLLDAVHRLITDGVLSIVVDKEVKLSDRSVDDTEFPSQNHDSVENTSEEESNGLFKTVVDNSRDVLAMNGYLSEYLDCYTDGKFYDLEYIVGQGTSDKENLKSAVHQMILLRQGMNLMYLLTDAGKRQMAQTAAAALLAVTANPVLIQAMAMLILTAWAYAEAVSDVRTLVNDKGSVAFIKNSGNWKLSLEQAANIQNWKSDSGGKKDATGMKYEEYLRMLLFFHRKERNMFRGLDMIQWNICQTDPGFRVSQCVYRVEAQFSIRVRPVFAVLNGINWKNGYVYEHKEQKAYG